ncbi:hypothetical protein T492DRAFT_406860 [Pavlovales sp. CCMP2436]|nr:hypothetical protein T492DRAFT_406860 [Pavlovales sp. CCMP2436]
MTNGTGVIPRVVHFVHGLATSAVDVHFGYEHYLAVVAASTHIRPEVIVFHHHHRPSGEWWERAAPLLTLRHIPLPTEIFGRPLVHAAHRADIVRLRALLEKGGVYLDMDVIALRSFDQLLDSRLPALGREGLRGEHGLCNAVIVSPPGAPFLARWLEAYRTFDGSQWAEHSVALPMRLAKAQPADIRLLEAEAFFWPLWDDAALRRLLLYREYGFERNFATHLWSQAARPYVLSLWSPRFAAAVPSALNCRTRMLPQPAGSAGAESLACGCEAGARAPGEVLATGEGVRVPLHRWELSEAQAFGHGGVLEANTRSCFARNSGGGCAHLVFFAAGCGLEEAGEPRARIFRPYAPAHAGLPRQALSWSGGLEGFAALSGEWAADFSLSWWAAARGEPAPPPQPPSAASGLRVSVWWSLVFAGGGELQAALEAAADGGPGLEPVLRTRALHASPLPCAGLRAGVAAPADGSWHSYAVHVRAAEVLLQLDGRTVARARWRPASRPVGLWLGTAEPPIAGRARPAHELDERRRVQLSEVRLYAPALRGASEEGLAHRIPDGWPAGYEPPPLLQPVSAGLFAVGARTLSALPCDAAAEAVAAPATAALGLLCLALACFLALGLLLARRAPRARAYRLLGGGAALPQWSKSN